MKLLYFDCCALQRPWDDRTQPRIAAEAAAVEMLKASIENGALEMASSAVLEYELEKRPPQAGTDEINQFLNRAMTIIWPDEAIRVRAAELRVAGIRDLDAIHYASAERIRVSYFCTCDDSFLTKLKKLVPPGRVPCYNPIELVKELGL